MTIDTDLARRLEIADILGAADYAHTLNRLEPGAGARILEVGGGFAVLMGPRFPITASDILSSPN